MKCRRICRELLWLARFGEFGPSSQPHLDHLAGCESCRDEVGYDRAMVQQLRIALAERIEGMEPSPSAWEGVLERALLPEQRGAAWLWQRSTGLVARLRTATAVAGTGLALVLALNMEVVAVPAPEPEPAPAASAPLQQVPHVPTGRTTLAALGRQASLDGTAVRQPDIEAVMTQAQARITTPPGSAPAATEQFEEASTATEVQVLIGPAQGPELADPEEEATAEESVQRAEPVRSRPGAPS